MTPIRADGSADPARAVVYTGEAQMMTNMGPLPINFEIVANSLAEAVAAYVAARDRRDAALARAGLPSYEDMSDHWFEAMTGKAR